MSAGPQLTFSFNATYLLNDASFEYLWADKKNKTPVSLSAPGIFSFIKKNNTSCVAYIDRLSEWAFGLLSDQSIFPENRGLLLSNFLAKFFKLTTSTLCPPALKFFPGYSEFTLICISATMTT